MNTHVSGWYVFMRRPVAIALVAVLLISSGGISYAAEGALPGDILYPIKVGVNEQVRSALAVTPEDKASVAADRAVARLDEASALATEGKLTPAAEASLTSAFAAQADAATQHMDALKDKDSSAAITVASDFESELAAHVEMLDDINPDGARDIKNIAMEKAHAFSSIRASAESKNDVSAAVAIAKVAVSAAPMAFALDATATAEHASSAPPQVAAQSDAAKMVALRMGEFAKKTASTTTALVVKMKAHLSADDVAQTAQVQASAHSKIEAGDAAFHNGEYSAAFHDYQDAFVALTKLNVFLKTNFRGNFRIKVQEDSHSSSGSATSKSSVSSHSVITNVSSSDTGDGTPPPSIQILSPGDGQDIHVETSGDSSVHIESHVSGSSSDSVEVHVGN
jgi:hypothetical protein